MPLVTCYSLQDNICATQAWAATQDNKGTLFFGTSDGLLSYDGVRWENHSLPGVATVRAVEAIGDRIYVGAYEEFGYFEFDKYGLPVYHSLNYLLKDYNYKDDEFWAIIPSGNKVYFQSFRSIFCYDGQKVDIIESSGFGPLNLFNIDGKLYSQIIYRGLNSFDGEKFEQVAPREKFGSTDVVSVLRGSGKGLVICTEKEGIYIMKDGTPTRLRTDADEALKAHCINRAIQLRDGTIVAGTLRNGVYG